MSAPCRQYELELSSSGGALDELGEELRAHVAMCAVCSRLVERLACQTSLLRSLPRASAPRELDGRVVAVLHAGHREERVAGALAGLTRTRVPRELERALADRPLGDPRGAPIAPAVLERLVSDDLRDPSKALSRRFTGRLPRLRAPEELAARVEAMLLERAPPPRRRRLVWQGALVLIAGLTGALAWQLGGAPTVAPPPSYRFTVRYVDSVEALRPEARTLLAALSGGASELPGLLPAPRSQEAR